MMRAAGLLEHAGGDALHASYLAVVASVQDPDKLGRVQVRLLSFDGVSGQDGPVWARVALPFAGDKRGCYMLPDVDDEVLVSFVNGDARFPVVIGGLWNGKASPPESLSGDHVNLWTITGKAGTRIAIEEKSSGQEQIVFTTPGGVTGKLTDASGGKVELSLSGGSTKITLDSNGISLETGGKVKVQASQLDVTSGQVKVNAAMSQFSGVVQCDTLIATTVVGSTYTPGAGNVW